MYRFRSGGLRVALAETSTTSSSFATAAACDLEANPRPPLLQVGLISAPFCFPSVATRTDSSRVRHNLFGDGPVRLHHDLVDLERRLDRIRLIVHPFELLERTTLRLDAGKRTESAIRIRSRVAGCKQAAYPKRYHIRASKQSQPTKTYMYRYLMFPSAIGPANWLINPMALTIMADAANPFARVVDSSASVATTA